MICNIAIRPITTGVSAACWRPARLPDTHETLVDYLNEGVTTANRKASLRERYAIMCRYYGTLPTFVRHLWFAVRFAAARLTGRE